MWSRQKASNGYPSAWEPNVVEHIVLSGNLWQDISLPPILIISPRPKYLSFYSQHPARFSFAKCTFDTFQKWPVTVMPTRNNRRQHQFLQQPVLKCVVLGSCAPEHTETAWSLYFHLWTHMHNPATPKPFAVLHGRLPYQTGNQPCIKAIWDERAVVIEQVSDFIDYYFIGIGTGFNKVKTEKWKKWMNEWQGQMLVYSFVLYSN